MRDQLVHLIDGDPVFAQALSEVLVDQGYPVHKSTDGAEALQYLSSSIVPALVVADFDQLGAYRLPIASLLATGLVLRLVPVVLMSSGPAPRDVRHRLFVRKPFIFATFLRAIAQLQVGSPH